MQKSEYELQRERNILELRQKLGFIYNPNAIGSDQKSDDDVEDISPVVKRTPVRKRKHNSDLTFQGHVTVNSKERRQSLRLAKIEPSFSYRDLADVDNLSDNDPDEDLNGYVKSIQKIVNPAKRRSLSVSEHTVIEGFRIKEFTEQDIKKIAKRSKDKKRSRDYGNTCHQCRQHTTDTKSFCHNVNCSGINGQLCGPCLRGRYGEDLETVLRNPRWICPFCRGICNCSFCRRRNGRLPTGILTHVANKQGYKSVHHLLNLSRNPEDKSTDEEDGDKENEDVLNKKDDDEKVIKTNMDKGVTENLWNGNEKVIDNLRNEDEKVIENLRNGDEKVIENLRNGDEKDIENLRDEYKMVIDKLSKSFRNQNKMKNVDQLPEKSNDSESSEQDILVTEIEIHGWCEYVDNGFRYCNDIDSKIKGKFDGPRTVKVSVLQEQLERDVKAFQRGVQNLEGITKNVSQSKHTLKVANIKDEPVENINDGSENNNTIKNEQANEIGTVLIPQARNRVKEEKDNSNDFIKKTEYLLGFDDDLNHVSRRY